MKIISGAARLAAVVTVSAAVAGCGGGLAHREAAQGVFVGQAEPVVHGSLTAGQVAADETAFGLQLLGRICAAAPTTNAVLSPTSAGQALEMLDAGARGTTQQAVSQVLHLPDWSPALVAALHDQTVALRAVHQVAVSNHVFEQLGVAPARHTLDDLRTAFQADLRAVDFAGHSAGATAQINQTVSEDTRGLIPTLFDNPLDPSTQTVLTDAIYLHANWQTAFAPAVPAPFHTAAGRTVTRPLMDGTELQAPLRAADGWQSVSLPYQGQRLQAVALLPPSSATRCPAPSPPALAALTSGSSARTVGAELPKFQLSQTLMLRPVLAALGLPLVGDYSGLGAGDGQISEVVQKVVMKVDEKGTTAAAATGVAITVAARMPSSLVVFDRPFLFLIEDTATHTPLFLTYIADPT